MRSRALALLVAAGMTMFADGRQAFAQLPPLPPPPGDTLPILPPLPPLDLPLGPPELPRIPSLPQVLPSNAPDSSGSTQLPVTSATVDAKVLVISADGTEPVLGAIRQALDHAGTPYTLYVAKATPGGFAPAMLSDGNMHAFYQGILMTTASLGYFNGTAWVSAFDTSEWQTLWDYQAKYRVRTAVAYALPTADLGYGPPTGVDASASPISARLTSPGRSVFPYVNSANPVVITRAWAYLARPTGIGTEVLLSDPEGNALALVRTHPDGREVLSMTFDGNFFLVHSLALMHGVLNWVTGGLLVGERHVHMTPQIDDIFLDNDMYPTGTYRLTGIDWAAMVAWQAQKGLQAQTSDVRLHMAFNGEGTTGVYPLDTLTPATDLTDAEFPWINHTFTHENLDATSYDRTYQEITRNNEIAVALGLEDFDRRALVTPDVSGLANPAAMSAAYDAGIRFLVTDTSQPGMDNPSPQHGIPNALEPRILMIPRRPVNLYYNVSTPAEWTSEYNAIYRSYWGRDLGYAEILDKESDVLLQYMLRGEVDPWMFHQANLRAYDGVHSLLGDLLDRTLEKYGRLCVLPVRSLGMARLGEWMANRMRRDAAGVRCSFVPDQGILTLTAADAAVVAVTGLCTDSSETYGGQCITHVSLNAGQTVTFSFPPRDAGRLGVGGSEPNAGSVVPSGWLLRQNRPNPFRSTTRIALDLPRASRVDLKVFDAAGRLVRTVVADDMPAGSHVVEWDGRDDRGAALSHGLYFCELRAGPYFARRRMVLVR